MKGKVVVRASKLYRSKQSVLLRLFHVNECEEETLLATSSPVHKVASLSMCRLLEDPATIGPSITSLQNVLRMPGRTAWASAAGPDTMLAAQQACLQHDIKGAQGVLVVITLSPDFGIVRNVQTVMNIIQWETPSVTARALTILHDGALHGELRVEILLTGI